MAREEQNAYPGSFCFLKSSPELRMCVNVRPDFSNPLHLDRESEHSQVSVFYSLCKLMKVFDSPLKGRASWHSFRATFITRLTENGCPQAIVKELAQHVRADVTQRYVHVSMAVKDKWLRTLPDLGEIDLSAEYPPDLENPVLK